MAVDKLLQLIHVIHILPGATGESTHEESLFTGL
jgi:hypothetical protein